MSETPVHSGSTSTNFKSSCLSCSAQHRGADAAFLRRPVPPPSGGPLPAGFARPCSRIIAPWHSPASMLLERTPQRANCHLTRACACCLQEFPRVASAQWVPVEHWTCGGSLALPSCSVDLRILAHVGLRRRLSCVLAFIRHSFLNVFRFLMCIKSCCSWAQSTGRVYGWEKIILYMKNSPIFQFKNLPSPCIIFHGYSY